MILEVPLPDDPRIIERWAVALGYKPITGQQKSETLGGIVRVIDTPNPESSVDFIIRKKQEEAQAAYAQREFDVTRSTLVENAKKEAESLGIVGYKEKAVELK